MAAELGRAKYVLEIDSKGFDSKLDKAEGKAGAVSKSIGGKLKGIGTGLTSAGRGLTIGLTAPIIGLGGSAIKMAVDFDKAFTEVTTLFDASTSQVNDLRADTLKLASTMGVKPTEAAKAMYQAISAGVKPAKVIGFLTDNVELAVGGVTDLETAVDLTTTVMNAWSLEAGELTNVNDSLFTTVRLGKTTITELGASMFNVATIASQFGQDIDMVGASLATMTAKGVPTSVATTQLKAAILALGAPTVRQIKRAEELGITLDAQTLREKGLIQTSRDLFIATGGQEVVLRKLLGSQEAMNAVLILGGEGFEDATSNLGEYTNKAGAAKKAFDKMNETIARQAEILKAQLSVALVELGTAILPILVPMFKGLTVVVKAISAMATALESMPAPIRFIVLGFIAFLAAIGPVLLIAGFMAGAIANLIPVFGFLAVAASGATASVIAFLIAAAPFIVIGLLIAAVVAGIVIGIILLVKHWDQVTAAFKQAGQAIAGVARMIGGILQTTVTAIGIFFKNLGLMGTRAVKAMFEGFKKGAQFLLDEITGFVKEAIRLLNPLNWVFGSSIIDIYEFTGEEAGTALVKALGRALSRVSGVADELVRPIERIREVIRGLHDELQRLAGLPTLESVAEELQTVQLELALVRLEPALRAAREAREEQVEAIEDEIAALRERRKEVEDAQDEQLDAIDDQISALERQRRDAVRDFGAGADSFVENIDRQIDELQDQRDVVKDANEERLDTIDEEIDAMEDQRRELEAQRSPAEKEAELIQDRIDGLRLLGRERELERQLLVLRGQAADATLAIDSEVMAAMRRQITLIGQVTREIDKQAVELHTVFIPAWQSASVEAVASAEDMASGVGEALDDLSLDISDLLAEMEEDTDETALTLEDLGIEQITFWDKIEQSIRASFGEIGAVIKDGSAELFQFIVGFLADTLGEWKTEWDKIERVSRTASNKVTEGIVIAFNAVLTFLGTLLPRFFRAAVDIGKQFASGLAEGIGSISGKIGDIKNALIDAVKGAWNAMIDWADRNLKISVSKKIFGKDVGFTFDPDLSGFKIMHAGGIVPGRKGEEVPTILEAGEFVLSADHPLSVLARNTQTRLTGLETLRPMTREDIGMDGVPPVTRQNFYISELKIEGDPREGLAALGLASTAIGR